MLQYLMVQLSRFNDDEEGQTAVEYGLVIALVALVLVGALAAAFGTGDGSVIDTIVDKIKTAL